MAKMKSVFAVTESWTCCRRPANVRLEGSSDLRGIRVTGPLSHWHSSLTFDLSVGKLPLGVHTCTQHSHWVCVSMWLWQIVQWTISSKLIIDQEHRLIYQMFIWASVCRLEYKHVSLWQERGGEKKQHNFDIRNCVCVCRIGTCVFAL